jgi:hypothetical protein
MKNPNGRVRPRVGIRFGDEFYLPDALAPIATVLFEDTWAARHKTCRESCIEVFNRKIEVGIGAPSQPTRAVEHLLDAHLENDVGVGAHPDPVRSDVPQQEVKLRSVLAVIQRVDPDEHAVHGQEASVDRFLHLLGVQDWFSD